MSPSTVNFFSRTKAFFTFILAVSGWYYLIVQRLSLGASTNHDNFHRIAADSPIFIRPSSSDGSCDRILLYASDLITPNTGVGHRIALYLLANVLAVLTDSALVILDPPAPSSTPDSDGNNTLSWARVGGSPFGCPLKNGGEKCGNLPTGLARIIQVAPSISRGCSVPCTNTHSYEDWFRIASNTNRINGFASTVCTTDDDEGGGGSSGRKKNVTVVALGKVYMVYFWVDRMRSKLFAHGFAEQPSSSGDLSDQQKAREERVTRWSKRMGASNNEIDLYLRNGTIPLVDYLNALITRAAIMQFQPWVVDDVNKYLQQIDKISLMSLSDSTTSLRIVDSTQPTTRGYDAMHIRRGDRIYTSESMKAVEKYWVERGYSPLNVTADPALHPHKHQREMKKLLSASSYPTKYVPFSQYWNQYQSLKCFNSGQKNGHASSSSNHRSRTSRHLYVATDDIETVRAEIANLTSSEGEGYWIHCNQQMKLVFNPQEHYTKHIHVSKHTNSQQRNETHEEGYGQYLRSISAITDLHILSQSKVYVGDAESYWGRILRTLRTSFQGNIPVIKDIRVAWGNTDGLPPPPW